MRQVAALLVSFFVLSGFAHYKSMGNDTGHIIFSLENNGRFNIQCDFLPYEDTPGSQMSFTGRYVEWSDGYGLYFAPYYENDGSSAAIIPVENIFRHTDFRMLPEPHAVWLAKSIFAAPNGFTDLFICNVRMEPVNTPS